MKNIQIIITMLVSIITLLVTMVKGIIDWFEFNKQKSIDLNSKTKLKWVEEVRGVVADFAKSYRIMVVTNSLNKDQSKKEDSYANFLHDAYLLQMYFATNKSKCNLNISGEYDRIYYKDPADNNYDQNEKCKKIKEANQTVLAPLYCTHTNNGKKALINELLKQFINVAKEENYTVEDNPNSKYSESLKAVQINDTSTKYFGRIMNILGIYLEVEENEARKGK